MGAHHTTCEAGPIISDARTSCMALVQAIRRDQWLCKVLVFLPMLSTHQFLNGGAWRDATIRLALFCLGASGQIIINELADVGWDRRSRRKRPRPLVAARHKRGVGGIAAMSPLGAGIGLTWLLPGGVLQLLLRYHICALAYSFVLKRVAIGDVIVLAALSAWWDLAGSAPVEIC